MEGWKRIAGSQFVLRLARVLWTPAGQIAIGVSFSLGLGWLAIRGIQWGLVGDSFTGFSWWYAVVAMGLFLASLVLRAYRWRVLFLREPVSLWRLFIVQNTGIGLNNLSPVRVLSEPAQFVMLTLRYKVHAGAAAATLGMERVLDMVGSTTMLAAGLIFIPARGTFVPYVLIAFVISSISVLLVYLLSWASRRRFAERFPAIRSFLESVAALERARGLLAYSLLLSIIYWFLVGVCAWLLAEGMGLGISPLVATIAILSTVYFATVVPALPGAVGTFEFAIVYFLGQFYKVPQEEAFSYALAVHALLFLPPTVIALLVVSTMGLGAGRGGRRALPTAEPAQIPPDAASTGTPNASETSRDGS